jgi:hypothetical protein
MNLSQGPRRDLRRMGRAGENSASKFRIEDQRSASSRMGATTTARCRAARAHHALTFLRNRLKAPQLRAGSVRHDDAPARGRCGVCQT